MKKVLLLLVFASYIFSVKAMPGNNDSLSIKITGKDTICAGDTTLLIANVTGNSDPVKYLWSPSTGLSCDTCDSVYASPDSTITYTVIAMDSINSDTALVTVVVDPLITTGVIIYPNGDTSFYSAPDTNYYLYAFCIYETTKAPGPLPGYFIASPVNGGSNPTYNWQLNSHSIGIYSDSLNTEEFGDGFGPGPIFDTFSYYASHSPYYCLLTCQITSSLTGCLTKTITTSNPDTITELGCAQGIGSISLDNSINFSPNPTDGTFLLSFDQPSQQLKIELLDIQGQSLYMEQIKDAPPLSKEYNFNSLAKGVYLLKITTENGIAVKRIVIQ